MAGKKKRKRRVAKSAQAKVDVVNIGNKIWLAGLGALARAQSEGPKLFEALVEEGSDVQDRTRESTERAVRGAMKSVRGAVDARVDDVRGRASETWDNIEKIFQSRVQKALQQLGVPTAHEIRSLTRKVDELTRSVQGLAPAKRDGRTAGERRRARAQQHAASHAGAVV